MIEFIKECISSNWRLNRKKFWLYLIWFYLIIIFIVGIFQVIADNSTYITSWFIDVIAFFWWISFIIVSFSTYIKRLHDLDKSWWLSLLAFVPLANIYLFIICWFFKWTEWPNKYWLDPLWWNINVINNNEVVSEQVITEKNNQEL